jgi:hypothetical protein
MAIRPKDPHSVAAAEIALNALFAKYRAADALFPKFRKHDALWVKYRAVDEHWRRISSDNSFGLPKDDNASREAMRREAARYLGVKRPIGF